MKRNGFTLLEMLVVVAIIVILSGFVFRMVAALGKRNDIAATQATLEKVAHALEEFRAIYGKYPNVPFYGEGRGQPNGFEFPNKLDYTETVQQNLMACEDATGLWKANPSKSHEGVLFTMGLVSFFLPRTAVARGDAELLLGISNSGSGYDVKESSCSQWYDYNRLRTQANAKAVRDSVRDLNAVRRILPHLDGYVAPDGTVGSYGIISGGRQIREVRFTALQGYREKNENGNYVVTNHCYRIADAWGQELQYRCLPPYDSYKLWSLGPTGSDADDIIAGEY